MGLNKEIGAGDQVIPGQSVPAQANQTDDMQARLDALGKMWLQGYTRKQLNIFFYIIYT